MEKSRAEPPVHADYPEDQHEREIDYGNDDDMEDMKRIGQAQQLSVGFTVLALTVVLTGTWFTWIVTFQYTFLNGGRGAASWVFLGSWAGSFLTVLSLAELASMLPVAGGQYQWVSVFAPPRYRKFLSYFTGWLGVLGWQCYACVSAYAAGNLILILASVTHPSYVPTKWQASLMTLAIAALATLLNISLARRLGLFEATMFVCFFGGLLGIAIPLWTLAPKASSHDVWTVFNSYGGWQPIGLACVVGQITSGGGMIGFDGAVHMAEEVRDASRVIPRVMIGSVIIGPALGLLMEITVNYSVQNVQTQVADSTAVYPFISVLQTAVGSRGGAIGMTVPIVILSVAAMVNALAAASREFWSFTRDRGFPFSTFLSKVSIVSGVPIPVRAVVFGNWFTIIAALLNLASQELFDAIIALCEGAVCTSYILSIASLMSYRIRYGQTLNSKFSLGRAALPINVVAILYNVQLVVFSYCPVVRPVTASNMNYGAAVFVAVILVAVAYYVLHGRRIYKPPKLRQSQ